MYLIHMDKEYVIMDDIPDEFVVVFRGECNGTGYYTRAGSVDECISIGIIPSSKMRDFVFHDDFVSPFGNSKPYADMVRVETDRMTFMSVLSGNIHDDYWDARDEQNDFLTFIDKNNLHYSPSDRNTTEVLLENPDDWFVRVRRLYDNYEVNALDFTRRPPDEIAIRRDARGDCVLKYAMRTQE